MSRFGILASRYVFLVRAFGFPSASARPRSRRRSIPSTSSSSRGEFRASGTRRRGLAGIPSKARAKNGRENRKAAVLRGSGSRRTRRSRGLALGCERPARLRRMTTARTTTTTFEAARAGSKNRRIGRENSFHFPAARGDRFSRRVSFRSKTVSSSRPGSVCRRFASYALRARRLSVSHVRSPARLRLPPSFAALSFLSPPRRAFHSPGALVDIIAVPSSAARPRG